MRKMLMKFTPGQLELEIKKKGKSDLYRDLEDKKGGPHLFSKNRLDGQALKI
jgi:hypothetical protein